MKELIHWLIISGLLFAGFVITIGIGLVKQSKRLVIISVFVFFIAILSGVFTGYKFITKSYHAATGFLKFRNGEEIYNDLFGKPSPGCVKIVRYQDAILPQIDYAVMLRFKTCPEELKRIVSLHAFNENRMPAKEVIPATGNDWLKPEQLGDTVLVYTYLQDGSANWQTIISNTSKTEAFYIDMAD